MEIFNVRDLHHEQLISAKTGEIFSKSSILSELFFYQKIFVHHEILAPAKRASSPHRHSTREEMIVVLEGQPAVHLGDQVIQLKPGDVFGFQPGSNDLHFIENPTDKEVRFLVICSNQEIDEIIF